MATFRLTTGNERIRLNRREVDTVVVESGSRRDRDIVLRFESQDVIDLSAFGGIDAQELIDNAVPRGRRGVILQGEFGRLVLNGIAKEQLRQSNFITDDYPSLFITIAPDALPDQPSNTNDPSIIRQQLVAVDFNPLVAADSREGSQTLNLNLFEDASFDVIFDSAELSSDNSSLVRVGTVEGEADSEVYLVNSTADNIAIGNVRIGDKFYQIRFVDDGIHAVREIDQTVFVDEAEIELDFESGDPVAIADGRSEVDDGSIIDVMVVYTPEARQEAGGTSAINQLINLAEAETNQGYENSGVIQRIRIVHTEEVPYTSSGDAQTDLSRLRGTSEGFLDEVHALRDTHSADIVSLFVRDFNAGGIGYVMGMSNRSYGFEENAFNAVGINYATGNYTFAHELGHNQGVTHNREDATGHLPSFNYAYGYRDPDRAFRTIMAYDDQNNRGIPRRNYWSNPDLTYNGKPLGIPGDTDNRRALNNNRMIAANWRHSNDNLTNAKEISGSEITSTALNVNATEETSEPNHAGNAGGKSVWWSWTAPNSGNVTITTAGSDFDSILGVYTGNSVFDLTPIASNDNDPNGGRTSRVTFDAVTGVDYKIAVDGFDGARGEINLNLTQQEVSVNNPPVAANDSATVGFESSTTIAVLANDTDSNGDELSIAGFSSRSSQGGTISRSGNGLRYTPADGFSGNDSFRYSISDGNGGIDSATVNVTVLEAPNQPPVAVNDSATVGFESSAIIDVLANDTDGNGDNLSITNFSSRSSQGGEIARSGNRLRYTPADGFSGLDSFRYTISDGNGEIDSATVTITVLEVQNQLPVAVNDFVIMEFERTSILIDVLANDTDSNGDELSSIADFPSRSSQGFQILRMHTNVDSSNFEQRLLYSPALDFAGNDSFRYTISDENGGTDSATVNITVLEAPNQSLAVNDSATVGINSTAKIQRNGREDNDIIIGGVRSDQLTGSEGANEFRYMAVTDSDLTTPDLIKDFNPTGENDTIRLAFLPTSADVSITNVGGSMFNLTVSDTNFSLDIQADSGITPAQILDAIQYGLG